ncbi:hypothetical protein DMENIID0001_096580 [Sergentomyia squamirostris]
MGLIVENTLCEVIIALISLITIGYFYVQYLFSYWSRNNVKCLKPSFPFGNFHKLLLGKVSMTDLMKEMYAATSEDIIGIYAMFKPVLLVRNAEIVRNILVKDFNSFHDRGVYVNEENDPLSGHLFALSQDKWKQLRAKMTPTFTTGKIKAMFPTFIETGNSLKRFLSKGADEQTEIEMRDLMARYTINNIASAGFGIEVDSIVDRNHEFHNFGRKSVAPTLKNGLKMATFMMLPRLAELIKMKTMDDDYEEYLFQVITQIIDHREQNNISRKDFMQLMLQLRNTGKVGSDEDFSIKSNSDGPKKMTINEIAAQAHVFFLAGFETTSTLMSFCLYLVAKNPQAQQTLQSEIDQVLQKFNGQMSYEATTEMKYLDGCLNESLRMYSPFSFLNRECNRDYVIPGTYTTIKKGTTIMIPLAGLQYDPQYYKEPMSFRPERFLNGEVESNSPYFLPFGDGPRFCIGMRMAWQQAKIGIAIILEKFNIDLSEKLQRSGVTFAPGSFIPTPKEGLYLRVSHRKTKNLLIHVKNHTLTDSHIFKCDECCIGFTSHRSLKLHRRNQHHEIVPGLNKCEECGLDFVSYVDLIYHISQKHDEINSSCFFCGEFFHSKTAMSEHILEHEYNEEIPAQ